MQAETSVWYKNGYVWLVLSLLMMAVIFSFVLLYVALKYSDPVVSSYDVVNKLDASVKSKKS